VPARRRWLIGAVVLVLVLVLAAALALSGEELSRPALVPRWWPAGTDGRAPRGAVRGLASCIRFFVSRPVARRLIEAVVLGDP
jgi:hypothetical protein